MQVRGQRSWWDQYQFTPFNPFSLWLIMFLTMTNWKHNFTIVSLTFPEVFRHLFELQQESQQQLFLMPRASSTPGVSVLLLSKYSQAQWGHTEVALSPLSFAVLMNTLMFADKVLICSESEEESLQRRESTNKERCGGGQGWLIYDRRGA